MKKILALVMATVICFGLCSCGLLDKVTAATLYAKAAKTLQETETYEINCDMTMGIETLGISMDMDIKMNMKQAGENMQISMNLFEQDVVSTFLDGYMYVDAMGQGIKYSVDDTTLVEEDMMSDSMTTNLPEIAMEVLESTEVVVNEDGTKSLSIALTDEQSEELLGVAASMYANMTFENTVFTLDFDEKNNFKGMSISSDYKAEEAGIELGGKITAVYEFVNLGEEVVITLPSDADSYIDGGRYEDMEDSLM